MTKVKHIFSPWVQDGIYIEEPDKTLLATVHIEDSIGNEAVGKLIAAAPELLDALMHLLHDFEEEVQSVDPDSWKFGDPGSWTEAITKARAAIKKATEQ
jgi:hypothetical protein